MMKLLAAVCVLLIRIFDRMTWLRCAACVRSICTHEQLDHLLASMIHISYSFWLLCASCSPDFSVGQNAALAALRCVCEQHLDPLTTGCV